MPSKRYFIFLAKGKSSADIFRHSNQWAFGNLILISLCFGRHFLFHQNVFVRPFST